MDLKEYGLNNYESKAYVTLIREGICTAPLLSKKSSVPHGKIYPILESLEEKGFVKKYEGKPKRFIAVEPKIVVEEVIRKKEQNLKELKNKSIKLMQDLGSVAGRKSNEPLERIRTIEGYKNYLNLSVTLHEKAQKEWLSISRIPVYKPHLDAYRNCIKRGVNVKILTSLTDYNEENLKQWKETKASIRKLDFLPGRFTVIDDKDVIIRISGEGKYLALWIQSQALAKSAKNYFNYLWKKGESL